MRRPSNTGTSNIVANLSGIRFDQVYGDSSGGAEFDADGDGSTTQEDEFVSFTNTTGSTVDVSGWADVATEGGVESGTGGENTNFLTEGDSGTNSEAVYLVYPDTGDYIVFNMSSSPLNPAPSPDFPATITSDSRGRLDPDCPAADLVVSPQHRILVPPLTTNKCLYPPKAGSTAMGSRSSQTGPVSLKFTSHLTTTQSSQATA